MRVVSAFRYKQTSSYFKTKTLKQENNFLGSGSLYRPGEDLQFHHDNTVMIVGMSKLIQHKRKAR